MKNPKKSADNQAGFTLIEIMVVVVILSIMAAFVVPKIMDRPEQARLIKAQQDIRTLENALRLYKLDNLYYPSTDQSLQALIEEPDTEPLPRKWAKDGYIDRLADDPWGTPYLYLQPGVHGNFDIFSLGPDGQSDTEDDLGNWNLD
ncbi:MAG: type II secretion system major pseudopilin GspG [Desulfobulbaceae bacterium]|nr:type II secretion system major pseudopilin GspG [Desulfobulbaceae bacterium]